MKNIHVKSSGRMESACVFSLDLLFSINTCHHLKQIVASLSSLVLYLQPNFSLQQQTLVLMVMAVNMSALKGAITYQRAPVLLITSWRVMERPAEVLDSFVFTE